MKTKIKSLIIICMLGLVGVLNANAALNYNNSVITGTLEEQNIRFENLYSTEFVFNEDANAAIDYEQEAQMVTKWIADKEEAKAIQMLFDNLISLSNEETASLLGEEESENLNSAEFVFSTDVEIDYQKEALLVTKWIADKEEAKVVQGLIDAGRLAENR